MAMIKAKALVKVALDDFDVDTVWSLDRSLDQAITILKQAKRELADHCGSDYY